MTELEYWQQVIISTKDWFMIALVTIAFAIGSISGYFVGKTDAKNTTKVEE